MSQQKYYQTVTVCYKFTTETQQQCILVSK